MLVTLLEGFTVHKESIAVEEIKEVQLRSRRAQFIYDVDFDKR